MLRVTDPDHLGTLRAIVRRPLLNDDVLTRIEDTIHLILCRYAEQTAVVIPVEILGKLLAVVGADFFTLLAVPEGGLTTNIDTPLLTLSGHRRKVAFVEFNPVAELIAVSASA